MGRKEHEFHWMSCSKGVWRPSWWGRPEPRQGGLDAFSTRLLFGGLRRWMSCICSTWRARGWMAQQGTAMTCSIDWPFLAAWLNSKCMWKTAQKLPNSYVREPALPLPFGILLLTSNFAIHSPGREDKENQLSTTIIFLVKSTHLCFRAHVTKFVFHNVSWAWLNCSNF